MESSHARSTRTASKCPRNHQRSVAFFDDEAVGLEEHGWTGKIRFGEIFGHREAYSRTEGGREGLSQGQTVVSKAFCTKEQHGDAAAEMVH